MDQVTGSTLLLFLFWGLLIESKLWWGYYAGGTTVENFAGSCPDKKCNKPYNHRTLAPGLHKSLKLFHLLERLLRGSAGFRFRGLTFP